MEGSDSVPGEPGKRRPNGSGELRLPRDVLVRVDVFRDANGEIRVFTRERLPGRWGDERSEVATLLVETGLEVLNGFDDAGEEQPSGASRRSEVVTPLGSRTGQKEQEVPRIYA